MPLLTQGCTIHEVVDVELKEAWERFTRSRASVLGLVIIAPLILIGVFAPVVVPYHPKTVIEGTATKLSIVNALIPNQAVKVIIIPETNISRYILMPVTF